MKSIAEIFDNSKQLLDSITNFIDKYIGASLLRKCNITKIVDSITESTAYEYADNPLIRLIGTVRESGFLERCVSAGQLLTDKILAGFLRRVLTGCLKQAAFSVITKKTLFTALISCQRQTGNASSWKQPVM